MTVQYFSLLSHLLEVYPETVAQLNNEAFGHVLGTLDFGLRHQVTNDPPFLFLFCALDVELGWNRKGIENIGPTRLDL
jgi:hypothetical protein